MKAGDFATQLPARTFSGRAVLWSSFFVFQYLPACKTEHWVKLSVLTSNILLGSMTAPLTLQSSRPARRFAARNADRIRSTVLGVPRRSGRALPVYSSAKHQVGLVSSVLLTLPAS